MNQTNEQLLQVVRDSVLNWVDSPSEASETLSALAELEARLPRWIPVSERLPDRFGGPVIVCMTLPTQTRATVIHGDAYWKGDKWQNDEGIELDFVTHWMPLPQPPAGEQE